MSTTDRIRTFDDVERVQQRNEASFDDVRNDMGCLAERTSDEVADVSKKVDSGLEDVRQTLREISARWKESDKRQKKADKRQKEANKRHDEKIAALFEQSARTDAQLALTAAQVAETSAKLKNIGIEVGSLGNTRGEFVEHLALPSIERIVRERLKADFLGGYRGGRKGMQVQIDAWATSESEDEVYVFEIKRKFSAAAVEQVFRRIGRLRALQPEYAFIAAAVISEEDERTVWDAGAHLLKFGDGAFQPCQPPEGFRPEHGRGIRPHYLRRLAGAGGRKAATH